MGPLAISTRSHVAFRYESVRADEMDDPSQSLGLWSVQSQLELFEGRLRILPAFGLEKAWASETTVLDPGLGSPVRAFTRVATRSTEIGEVPISEGDRVLILYGAANRDERHYAEPDRFDVTRAARDHLAFGHGVHRCAGSHLAQLEMESLLRALVASVRRIDVGEPRVLLSNMLCGYESFDASLR